MGWPDYSGDWQYFDGVAQGSVVTQGGAQIDVYYAIRENTPTTSAGGFAVDVNTIDETFRVWGYAPAGGVDIDAGWIWGGVDYVIIGGHVRRDGSQSTIYCRRARS